MILSTESLHSLVTAAIWRAEQLDELEISSAPLAWTEVSSLEERLAEILPASQPEGRIARRGAVRAALKAGDYSRAEALAQRYLAEENSPESLKVAISQILEEDASRPRTKVLLAGSHPIILAGLRAILQQEYVVAGEATNGQQLLDAVERQRPDLVIAELLMPDISGIEATRRLKRIVPKTLVLILGADADPVDIREALEAGATAYSLTTLPSEEIATVIRTVLKGRLYVSSADSPRGQVSSRSIIFDRRKLG